MKLSIGVDWGSKQLDIPMKKILLAEKLGFDCVFCAEAYGSDALTPLTWIAAHTKSIRLATSIAQIGARPPATCAMQFNTLDMLAGRGRVVIGLGMSGPQIIEGWYGQPWGRPYYIMRDYVAIIRKILARKGPVTHAGKAIKLPTDLPGNGGYGKPLKSILDTNPDIPVWLGTGSERMVTLTAEIADGWLPMGFVPGSMPVYRPWLEEGFRRAGDQKSLHNFHIQCGVQVLVSNDVKSALDSLRPMVAFYVGGMGHRDKNFHKEMMIRRGYPEEARRIQELFLAGRREEAEAAVPEEYLDDGALIGPPQRIGQRFRRWQDSEATGLTLYFASEDAMHMLAKFNNK